MLSLSSTETVIVLSAIALTALVYNKAGKRSHPPYPPGPPRLPLLGNLLNFPSKFEWLTYEKWCKELGTDIIYLNAAGSDIIVLNSLEAIDDLLEKRSSKYSSRPSFPMTVDLMGWDCLFSLIPYGDEWKDRRRIFVQYFHPSNGSVYKDNQTKFIQEMLPRLLESPEKFMDISRHSVAGSALSLAYGLPIQKDNDPLIDLAQRAVSAMNVSVLAGNFLVNILPALKYVPEFVPGTSFKRKAREWKKLQEDMINQPFDLVEKQLKAGVAQPSFTAFFLQQMGELDKTKQAHERKVIKDSAGSLFVGSADTTLASIQVFLLAMLCFPEPQRKAQEELDRVLGGRLPDFNDEQDLPYISAIVREVLRWKPIAPIAVPHTSIEGDVYKGYYIPKGSVVIPNSWSLLQDESYFPEPSIFRPERFMKDGKLDPGARDPAKIAFGYGRRICPGSHVAMSFLWLTAATILKTFRISKAKDSTGNTIEPKIEFHPGVVCEPAPFECSIKPRSKEAVYLINTIDSGGTSQSAK